MPRAPFQSVSVEALASDLDAMSRGLTHAHADTFRAILADALDKDAYVCAPLPREVFFGDAPEGGRVVSGAMPHYGFFFGPMHYLVRRVAEGWRVEVVIGVESPPASGSLELPDCALARELEGDVTCRGTPYPRAPGTDACPGSGVFRAPATAGNVSAVLARWSREAEGYYNRDARAFGLPIAYDFEFVRAPAASPARLDMAVPLSPTCGRTPYFSAFRTGWSLPVVAHEVGHVLGLLDEYETFSGIVRVYPKTPFPGAEISRMGLSMKEDTRILPLHHYLILRRYFCPEPTTRDPYANAL